MGTKQASILLRYLPFYVPAGDNNPYWRVQKVTDSIQHAPGDILDKPTVKDLCENGAWKVTIISHDAD